MKPALLLSLAAVLLLPLAFLSPSEAWQDGDDFEYALVEADHENGSVISVSSRSFDHVTRLKEEVPGAFFWFALDGQSYVVRDASAVDEAMRITEPMRVLGAKQGALGAKQGAIGAKQGAIGGQQGVIGARQGSLGARLAALAAREAYDGESSSTRSERAKIEAEMEDLGRQMEELARRMEPLGEQQEVLGAEQAKLGKQQESVSRKAHGELRRLAEKTKNDGRAKPVED